MTDDTVNGIGEMAAEKVTPLAEAADTASRAVTRNIGLTLIGGMAVGLVAGALLPLSHRRKRPKTVRSLVATVSELSQMLAAQALDRAETAASESRDKLDSASQTIGKSLHHHSASLGKQTRQLADDAADQLNTTGKAIARTAVRLIEKARS